jgi:hypothetical protein
MDIIESVLAAEKKADGIKKEAEMTAQKKITDAEKDAKKAIFAFFILLSAAAIACDGAKKRNDAPRARRYGAPFSTSSLLSVKRDKTNFGKRLEGRKNKREIIIAKIIPSEAMARALSQSPPPIRRDSAESTLDSMPVLSIVRRKAI